MKATKSLNLLQYFAAMILIAFLVIPTISAQPGTITTQRYSNKSGTGIFITTDYDTVNAQGGAATIYIPLPDTRDSIFYGGDWTGHVFLEIDTLAGNLTQHDLDFSVVETPSLTAAAASFVTAKDPWGTAAAVTSTPSLVAGAGTGLIWMVNGARQYLKIVIADGVLRYRYDVNLKRHNDLRY